MAGEPARMAAAHCLGAMPNRPKTPHRTIRVAPELWERARVVALDRGETLSDVIRRALEEYAK